MHTKVIYHLIIIIIIIIIIILFVVAVAAVVAALFVVNIGIILTIKFLPLANTHLRLFD